MKFDMRYPASRQRIYIIYVYLTRTAELPSGKLSTATSAAPHPGRGNKKGSPPNLTTRRTSKGL